MERYDAVVVGAGPNGLTAATTLAEAGLSVLVLERAETIGGGARTEEWTLPGVRHDTCSTVHPLAVLSPYLRSLPLAEHGLRWSTPPAPMAHVLDAERAVILPRSYDAAVDSMGEDGPAYARVMGPVLRHWAELESCVFAPLARTPSHPVVATRFAVAGARSAVSAARRFRQAETRALFAGCAAHSLLPLQRPPAAAFGWLLMATAHLTGWPVATGGSSTLVEAVAGHARRLGVEIRTGEDIRTLDQLPPRRVTLLDMTPEGLARVAGGSLPPEAVRRITRYRRGPGVFKVDATLDGPIPWTMPELADAGTIHLDGTLESVASAEADTFRGRHPDRPFVLVVQATRFDPSRAPEGRHTLWAYAHVPNGSRRDLTDAVIDRIAEFAPGLRERILAVRSFDTADLERHNPNYVGGDIAGGAHTMRQLVFRPFPQRDPYATPIEGVYLCSSATPPGAGTHGMCGHLAARSALRWIGT